MQTKNVATTLVLLLITLVLFIGDPQPATGQAVYPFYTSPLKRAVAGVWEGDLDFANLGDTRVEPLTMNLTLTGDAIMVSEHEPVEIESATIGIWENRGGGRIEIGIQAHRLGDGACAVIAPPDGAAGDECILRIYGDLRLAGKGRLLGDITLIFQEVDATTGDLVEVVTPALGAEFRKLDMRDFRP